MFANVQFEIGDNGCDFSFVGRTCVYHPRAREQLDAKLGDFLPLMKCAIFDWSDRFLRIEQHLQVGVGSFFFNGSENSFFDSMCWNISLQFERPTG